jgi:hypothetical protein
MPLDNEFLFLKHENLPGAHLLSIDEACASGATKSYGGHTTMVYSSGEVECGCALDQKI